MGFRSSPRFCRARRSKVVESIRVLVLNHTYEPINVCNARRAIRMMLLGKAETLESEDEFWIRSEFLELRLPIVIRLLRYVKTPRKSEVPFSKKKRFPARPFFLSVLRCHERSDP